MSALRKLLVTSFQSDSSLHSDNSFLKETDRNSNVDDEIRREIEKKFKRSKVNATYHFPRAKQKPNASVSFSNKAEPRASSKAGRIKLRVHAHHFRAASEMSSYSPYMTRTPDLRPVKDRLVLRPKMFPPSMAKSSTPSPGRTLRFQKMKRLPEL